MISTNWGILGHEWAVHLLKHHAAHGNHRHAYLITGPDSLGRRTLALRFTQALNCPNPITPGEPCRSCQTCKQIDAMQHPDLAIVQAEQSGGILKVDQIRELLRSLSLAPYSGNFRVAVLLRFEEANPSAANALLKTLEEPPPKVILILTAESAESTMPTILSRCELVRLRPVPSKTIFDGLISGWNVPGDEARLLSQICDGRPGYALRLHREPALLSRRNAWLDDQHHLLAASRVDRFAYAERLAKDKGKTRAILAVWQSFWRDVLLRVAGSNVQPTNIDRTEEVAHLANRFSIQGATRVVHLLQESIDLIDRNVNPRLVLEVFLLDLPSP